MHLLVRQLLWPVGIGLLVGLLALPFLPQNRSKLVHWLSVADSPPGYADAVSHAAPAVVSIFSQKTTNSQRNPLFDDPLFRHFFNSADVPQQKRMSLALGSGVIINQQGYLLTNHHVIANADEIIVSLYDGRESTAKVIGTDPETDLAVLKINLSSLAPITLGEPQKSRTGDIVLAIGNPFSVGQTVTQGIISATGRHGLGINVYENFLQTDAAINPGNSGGALIDTQGRLLGINTAILNNKQSGSAVGIGFAVPADIAVTIMNDIIVSGRAIRGWLGIEARTINPSTQTSNGVMITGVYDKGPAASAGIQIGDIITHINQQAVSNAREGMNLIANVHPQDHVQITLIRQGQTKQIKAIVGTRPQSP